MTGSLLIVISAIAFGFMALFASWTRAEGVSTEMLLFLRFGIAGSALAGWMVIMRERWLRGRDLALALLMGGVLYAGMSTCYFHGLRHIPAGLVALLLYLYPVIVTILARVLLQERITGARVLAIALAVLGLLLTICPLAVKALRENETQGRAALGIALGIGTAICYSMYILIGGSVTRRAGAIPASTIVMLAAAAVFGAITLARGDARPVSALAWCGVAGLALIATLLAVTAFLAGLQRVGPVQASTLSTLEAVTTVVVGAALLGESFSLVQMLGGVLILLAAILVARTSRAPAQYEPPQEATDGSNADRPV